MHSGDFFDIKMVTLIATGGTKAMMFQFRVWLEERLGFSMFWWKFVCWIIFGLGVVLMIACGASLWHLISVAREVTPQGVILIVASAAVFWLGFFLADGSYTEAAHGF